MLRKTAAAAYIIAYVVVVVLFLLQPVNIKTDLMDILPRSGEENALKDAVFANVADSYSAQVNILLETAPHNLKTAKEAGLFLQQQLEQTLGLEVQFTITPDTDLLELLARHNYRLLSDNYRKLLQNREYQAVSDNAVNLVYSPVKANILPLTQDPFLLSADFLMNLGLLKSGFTLNMDMLTAEHDAKAYAFMMVKLDKTQMFAPAYLLKTVSGIYAAQNTTLSQYPDINIVITGVPVHSYIATKNSSREINIISGLSLLCIILISYVVFRSWRCFGYAVITIGLSFGPAFALTHLVFGGIHILVLVFGASLIGLCIDYHLHFFVEKAYEPDAYKALKLIQKAITLSLLTSLTGFVVMLMAGITILSQMAVFALTGLISAYLIIMLFYPWFLRKRTVKSVPGFILKIEKTVYNLVAKSFNRHFAVKTVIILAIFAAGIGMANVSSDLRNLYRPKPQQLAHDILFAKVSQMGSAPVMFITATDCEAKALELEEKLRRFLDDEITRGNIQGYKAVSQLIPSPNRQAENYALSQNLISAELNNYADSLGLDADMVEQITANFNRQQGSQLTLADLMQYEIAKPINNLWLDYHGKPVSVVVVENVKDKNALAAYAETTPGLYFGDKLTEISMVLHKSQTRALYAIFITLALIFALIFVYYRKLKKTLIILTPTIMAIVITVGILGFAGVTLTLFNLLALFLVICFSVDYSIFRVETHNKVRHGGVGVMLSCLTTIVSFGTLAFTGFEVTKALGITLSLGILLAYLLSPIAVIKTDGK